MGQDKVEPYVHRPVWSLAKTGLIALAFILIILSIVFALTMVVSVGVGHAVILVDPVLRSISDPIIGPTYAVKAPWVSAVNIYYATDSYEATVPNFSSDQLEMQIEVLVRWSLDTSKIKDLYNNYPNLNYKKAIESILEETMRLITKNYTALETIEFRNIVRDQIEKAVLEELQTESSLAGALMQLEFDLKNIGYPEKYTSAIEDKLVAEQQKIQADFERQKILILANATAQEIIIKASGEAEAKVIEANATREAIELILTSVNQDGNETRIAELYLWVQALQRIAPEVEILIVGTDGIPVLIPTNSTTP
ncbi:MAG: SPFH domain-containing protein [Candidatus Bathyarchaeota archaeon]|nr:SPFH domain-containing protein [Candidatus Bathyarchaeota archaeon]MDH5787138.1 SPFH domain-containing protein [Candidatus Bathyarchaeota archaeon]